MYIYIVYYISICSDNVYIYVYLYVVYHRSSCSDDVGHQLQAQLEQQIHHDFHNLQSQHQQVAAQKLFLQQQQQQLQQQQQQQATAGTPGY